MRYQWGDCQNSRLVLCLAFSQCRNDFGNYHCSHSPSIWTCCLRCVVSMWSESWPARLWCGRDSTAALWSSPSKDYCWKEIYINLFTLYGQSGKWVSYSVCHLCLLQGSGGPGFSSTRGMTIFSAMSVSSENVGYTMKSMNPAREEIMSCAFQLIRCMETWTGSR